MAQSIRGMSEEDIRQQRGFFFEALKHLTTLAAASALVTLNVYREADLPLLPILFFFVLSLLFSAFGMVWAALAGTGEWPFFRGRNFLILGSSSFLAGLMLVVYFIA